MTDKNSKQHIALFCTAMNSGGAEKVILTLAEEFLALGCRVDLLLMKAEGAYTDKIPNEVRVIDFGTYSSLLCLWKYTAYIKREKPDVVLSALMAPNMIAGLARFMGLAKTRTVISMHNPLEEKLRETKGLRGTLKRALVKLTFPAADAVIAVSHAVGHELISHLPLPSLKGRLYILHNPIQVEDAEEIVDPRTGEVVSIKKGETGRKQKAAQLIEQDSTEKIILTAGRLHKQKDYPTLLKAFAHLRKEHDATLIILGEGPLEKDLKALCATLNIEKNVRFEGFQDDPYAYMAQADLFVLASKYEGFGLVLAEAMACGTPVISTATDGPKEILEDGKYGTLTPIGDAWALADAMIKTLEKPLDSETLKSRANDFKASTVAQGYLALLFPTTS